MTGDDLRARRAALGLSQARLATVLGVQQSTISRWEAEAMPIENPAMLDLALSTLEDRAMTTLAPTTKRIFFVHRVGQSGRTLVYGGESGYVQVPLAALTPDGRLLAETISTTVNGFCVVESVQSDGERQPLTPEQRALLGEYWQPDAHRRQTWSFGAFSHGDRDAATAAVEYLGRAAAAMRARGWRLVGESDSRMDVLRDRPALPWPSESADA